MERSIIVDLIIARVFSALHSHFIATNIRRSMFVAMKWKCGQTECNRPIEFFSYFSLHQILSQGINAQADALKYARTHFAKFVNIFQKEIQILMGALMYLPVGIENSPYRTLIAPEMWVEVNERIFFISPLLLTVFFLSYKGCGHILKGCLSNTRNYQRLPAINRYECRLRSTASPFKY